MDETCVAKIGLGTESRCTRESEESREIVELLDVRTTLIDEAVHRAKSTHMHVRMRFHYIATGTRETAVRTGDDRSRCRSINVHHLVIANLGATRRHVRAVTTLEHLCECPVGTRDPDERCVGQGTCVQQERWRTDVGAVTRGRARRWRAVSPRAVSRLIDFWFRWFF